MSGLGVVVVGAGPAGLACATVVAEAGRHVTIVDPGTLGGELLNVPEVQDMPGLEPGTTGPDLGARLAEAAEAAGVAFEFDTVELVHPGDGGWAVKGGYGQWEAPQVVLATGAHVRMSESVPGAVDFEGRGVSVCAMCDGPLFQGQDVIVVGDDDVAIAEAGILATHASSVRLLVPGILDVGNAGWRTAALQRVTVEQGLRPVEVLGDDRVTGIRVTDSGDSQQELAASGIFIASGRRAAVEFVSALVDLGADGGVTTDAHMNSTAAGIHAVGDVRSGSARTASMAIADGVVAARTILGRSAGSSST